MAGEWFEHSSPDHFWFQWRFEVLRALLSSKDLGGHLLEIGCGNGTARQQLESFLNQPVHGCDLDERALQSAPPGQGDLFVYDIHDRRAQWQSAFDTIFLLDTLEHIDNPVEFLRSVSFHLRDGGLLVLNVPSLQWLFSRYDEVAGHVKRYNQTILRDELMQAGYEVCQTQYWGLTTIPVLAVRKLMMKFTDSQRVIARGFQPGPISDRILRALMWLERRVMPRPIIGCSLAAVARKSVQD